jgi:hypothetical protein
MVEGRSKLARRIRQLTAPFLLVVLPLGAPARQVGAMPSPPDSAAAERPADRRLYLGMWTIHFRDLDRGLDNNWLLALSWGRVYGATFINSFGERAYSMGVQGTVARWSPGIMSLGLGYRAGLVTGYDERLFPLAGRTPVLPLLQPLITLDAQRVGVELSYSGVVASAGLNVRL